MTPVAGFTHSQSSLFEAPASSVTESISAPKKRLVFSSPLKLLTARLHETYAWVKQPLTPKEEVEACRTQIEKRRNYKIIRSIGSGAYGEVCEAEEVSSGRRVAIKVSKIIKISNPFLPSKLSKGSVQIFQTQKTMNLRYFELVVKEKRMLDSIQNIPHVVKSFDGFAPGPFQMAIVMELAPPNLMSALPPLLPRFNWSIDAMKVFIYQVASFLQAMAAKEIVHGDLKPENLAFDWKTTKTLKTFDFGSAFSLLCDARNYALVTRWYRPPEIILKTPDWGCSVDIWSFGCILFELVTGTVLFPSSPEARDTVPTLNDHLHLVTQLIGPIPPQLINKGINKDLYYDRLSLKNSPSAEVSRLMNKRAKNWKHANADGLLASRIYMGLDGLYQPKEISAIIGLIRGMVAYDRICPDDILSSPLINPILL